MKINKTITGTLKTLAFGTALIISMVQCSEEEMVSEEKLSENISTEIASTSTQVSSISVSGLYTEVAGDVDCSVCNYIVDSKESVIDGKELGFKPGTIICLKKSSQYGSLDFVNMEGSEQSPIIIGYCGN